MNPNSSISRKNFLEYFFRGALLALAASILYPVIRYLSPPKIAESAVADVMVGKIDQFPLNSGKLFRLGNKPGLLIRSKENKFTAFIATCTHLDCTVQYRQDLQLIWCACHNGKYDLSGKNISGPPPRPLTPLPVHIKADEIFISNPTA